mmetsp:Transcript_46702/g.152928  ORF Transcript_46702/g.152928 Transcript_46702/m.152928 type:complete len:275 (-) Transcript_46702:224-1048(-)
MTSPTSRQARLEFGCRPALAQFLKSHSSPESVTKSGGRWCSRIAANASSHPRSRAGWRAASFEGLRLAMPAECVSTTVKLSRGTAHPSIARPLPPAKACWPPAGNALASSAVETTTDSRGTPKLSQPDRVIVWSTEVPTMSQSLLRSPASRESACASIASVSRPRRASTFESFHTSATSQSRRGRKRWPRLSRPGTGTGDVQLPLKTGAPAHPRASLSSTVVCRQGLTPRQGLSASCGSSRSTPGRSYSLPARPFDRVEVNGASDEAPVENESI